LLYCLAPPKNATQIFNECKLSIVEIKASIDDVGTSYGTAENPIVEGNNYLKWIVEGANGITKGVWELLLTLSIRLSFIFYLNHRGVE